MLAIDDFALRSEVADEAQAMKLAT